MHGKDEQKEEPQSYFDQPDEEEVKAQKFVETLKRKERAIQRAKRIIERLSPTNIPGPPPPPTPTTPTVQLPPLTESLYMFSFFYSFGRYAMAYIREKGLGDSFLEWMLTKFDVTCEASLKWLSKKASGLEK